MIEMITMAAIKEFFSKLYSFCKKYWQLLAGMSIGIILFLISRDMSGMKKTMKKFKESSSEERDRSLEIEREKNTKVDEAINKFEKDIKDAATSLVERDERIKAEKDKEVDDLLQKESDERGAIAEEIQKKIDSI